MARRQNELFIGAENMAIDGATIKHPALIKVYANPNINKITDKPLNLIGIDIETNHISSEPRLLGQWDGTTYQYALGGFIGHLFQLVKRCSEEQKAIAYWNRLDPFILFKLFLAELESDDDRERALDRFGKISGEIKNGNWSINPVVEIAYGDYKFGIIQVIRSSIQFYYYDTIKNLKKVWAYDIATLFQNGLEKEATSRLPYYSKVDKGAHLVDWQRFNTDDNYRKNIVLKSNELDARAVFDLGYAIQEDFKNAFGYYPRTLVSQGSLARAAIMATLRNQYKNAYSEKELDKKVMEEVQSMGFLKFYDEWMTKYPKETVIDLYCLLTESYSGGYIEAVRYGSAPAGWYADIASAYPGVIQNLYDLRNATITTGTGEPPRTPNSYVFMRGTLEVPSHIQFNPITIKHPVFQTTNIRAVGNYRASYSLEERDFMKTLGTKFSNETWYHIQTEGKPSPLASVCMNFIELRKRFQAVKSTSQYMAKIAANSLYGILFEAVDMYHQETKNKEISEGIEYPYRELLKPYLKNIKLESVKEELRFAFDKKLKNVIARWNTTRMGYEPDQVRDELAEQGLIIDKGSKEVVQELERLWNYKTENKHIIEVQEIYRDGYRAGEFWNPLYASIITSRTRLLMTKAATAIEKAGGKVLVMMTDSIQWVGTFEMLPAEYWREKKTLGFYEKPHAIYDILVLGSGRYAHRDETGHYEAKRQGLNATDIHDPDGIILDDHFNWANALKLMDYQGETEKLKMNVRALISPGLILGNHDYNWKQLGLVVNETREVDIIIGKNKRQVDEQIIPKRLLNGLVETSSLMIQFGMTNDPLSGDHTLPHLRGKILAMKIVTRSERAKIKTNDRQKKFRENHKDDLTNKRKVNYSRLISEGFSRNDALKMRDWSPERIGDEIVRLKFGK